MFTIYVTLKYTHPLWYCLSQLGICRLLYTRVIGVLVFGVDKGYTLLEHALGLSKNGWIFWWFLILHIFSQWCSVCINIWRLSVHDMAYWKTVYWKFFFMINALEIFCTENTFACHIPDWSTIMHVFQNKWKQMFQISVCWQRP